MSTETKPMGTSNKPEVRVIKGSIAKIATRRINDGEVGFLYFYVDDRSDIMSTLVIGDDAMPMSKVVELLDAINKGAWERIDGALRVNAVTQEHITACFKELGIELEPPF